MAGGAVDDVQPVPIWPLMELQGSPWQVADPSHSKTSSLGRICDAWSGTAGVSGWQS